MEEKKYIVYDRDGKPVLSAPVSCRYDRATERSLIEAGYTIKIGGKRVTKKEVTSKC